MDIVASIAAKAATWWAGTTWTEMTWLAVGIAGQLLFSMRWIVQLMASERARASVMPTTFWYYSLIGGLMVLAYGIYRTEPVIIMGQFGVLVYARNIYFLLKGQAAPGEVAPVAGPASKKA